MDVAGQLEQLGLNDKEARVYLAGLEAGQETVFNIAKAAGLKRSTVYFVLNKLVEQGLVSSRQTRKAIYYSAVPPNRLLRQLERKETLMRELLPQLQEIYEQQPNKPLIRTFEGTEGVSRVYEEAIEFLKKSKEVLYFGSIKHYERSDFREIFELWVTAMKNKRHHAREILPQGSSNYTKEVKKNGNPNHIVQVMPKGVDFSENDNLIYGNKLAIFSPGQGPSAFVVVIENPHIADSYRTLFELAWASTTKS